MANSPFVADMSGLNQGIGGLISQKINERLEKKALEGDRPAQARLASRDPRSGARVGQILQSDQATAKENQAQADEFKRRIAKSFASAQTPEEKRGVLESVIPSLQGRPGMEALIADIQDDISRYDQDPMSVEREYAGANVLLDTQDAMKVGARKIFNDGTILQSTPAGPRIFAPDGRQLTGEEGQQQLQSAFNNEIALSGGKARASAAGGVEGRREGGAVELASDIAGAQQQAEADVDLATKPAIEEAVTGAKLKSQDEAEQRKVTRQRARDKKVFNTAMDSFRKSLGAAAAGPIVSQLTSLTSGARIADNAAAILFPAIKSMVRGPGEGSFTDSDAAQVMAMLPDRSMPRDAQAAAVDNIVNFVEAKLAGDETAAPSSGGGQEQKIGRFTVRVK